MRNSGFTLLELLIVIIVVGLLAAVGISQYTQAVAKARNAEAKQTLIEIRRAALAYYAVYGNWPPPMIADPVAINVDVEGDGTYEVSFREPTGGSFNYRVGGTVYAWTWADAARIGRIPGVYAWRIFFANGTICTWQD